jgi:hypothetical protein
VAPVARDDREALGLATEAEVDCAFAAVAAGAQVRQEAVCRVAGRRILDEFGADN